MKERKTIVITGVSSGVGYAAAELFISRGYRVVGLSRTSKRLPEKVVHFCVDLSDATKTEEICNEIITRYEKVDILINCAAVFESAPFAKQSSKTITSMVNSNILSYLNTTRHLLPGMLARKSGLIINISSVSGKSGIINQATYSATKHALDGFASALSKELHQTGVKITTLYPGGINTELWNPSNPYHGDVGETMNPGDVAEIIKFVTQLPPNVIMKEMVFFPANEIH